MTTLDSQWKYALHYNCIRIVHGTVPCNMKRTYKASVWNITKCHVVFIKEDVLGISPIYQAGNVTKVEPNKVLKPMVVPCAREGKALSVSSIGKPRVSPLRFLNTSAVIRYLICVYASHYFVGRPYHFKQTLRTANKF